MAKPVITKFNLLVPLVVQEYERRLPTAFDESLSLLEKMNKIIQYLHETGELVNSVVEQWNLVMEWVMNEGLKEAVNDKLTEWLDDGTLGDLINEILFKSKLDVEMYYRNSGLSVEKYGVKGDGTDETAKFQQAIDELAVIGGGKLLIPRGTFLVKNLVFPERKFYWIQGQGGRMTTLKPVDASSQILVSGGALNTDYFKMVGVRIESTFNHDYNKPLIDLKYNRDVLIDDATALLSGTGTLFRFDSSYVLQVSNSMLRLGRYSVGFDLTNITSPSEQQDTIRFENTTVFGNVGLILRRSGGNYHGITLDGLKVLNLISDGDYGAYAETTLSSDAPVGSPQVNVVNATGFVVNSPIVFDFGERFEMNKITGVNGNTIYLEKPLMYAHTTGAQVLRSGVCVSLANPFNVFATGCHSEGHPTFFMLDSAKGLDFIGNYSGTGEFLRICGGAQDINIGTTIMDGTDRNIVVKIPTWNTNTALTRVKMNGPFVRPSGSPTIVVQEGFDKNIPYEMTQLVSGVAERTINMSAGQGTLWQEITIANAQEQFRKSYDGELRWRNQVSFDYIRENTVGTRDGGHLYTQGAWNGGTLAMGGYHLWIDASNRLRIKYGLPTSDFDGAVVGSQS